MVMRKAKLVRPPVSDLPAASGPGMEERFRALQLDLLDKIKTQGWAVLHIMSDGKEPSFTYTVGAKTRRLPDLIISGLGQQGAWVLLNSILRAIRDEGLEVQEGRAYPQFANMPLAFKKVTPAQVAHRMYKTISLYGQMYPGESFDVFQVVYPDPKGRMPWDPGYDFAIQERIWER